MSSHKDDKGHNPVVNSQTSSESQGAIGLVEDVQILSSAKTPDLDSKRFALDRLSASKKRVYNHNVECTSSIISECDLKDIRKRYRIPSSVKMFVPKIGQTADKPPEGCFAVYKVMLECGLRLPANDFVNEILAMVGQAPAQLIYNSWVILTAFQVACHVAGVKMSADLFQYMHNIVTSNKDYIFFSHKTDKNLTLLHLPKRGRWEPYFFFVSANAFGEKIPNRFCGKKINFKCNRNDIELEYLKLKRKFTRRLLLDAYLDEEVLLSCNIYKDTYKRPNEDAYVLLLKANDALVQSAIAKNNLFVLKLIGDENLRSGIAMGASDVSIAFKHSEPGTKVALSPKLCKATSFTTEINNNESNHLPTATRFPFVSSRVKTEKVSTLDANGDDNDDDDDVEIIDLDKFLGCKNSNIESKNLPSATQSPVVSSRIKTEKVSSLDSNSDEDIEIIIDIDKFLGSKKKSSSKMTPPSVRSVPASPWLKNSTGKRHADTIPEAIPLQIKRKRPNIELTSQGGEELGTHHCQSSLYSEEIDAGMEEEHMGTGKTLMKEHKRELGSAPKVSNLNDQDELDSISVQLDAILKKGTQSLRETSDHRIQMTNILASLDYCHLEASLEKTARQVSNLRDKVNLLHSRHDKLVTCLKSYSQQVSDCKSNIEVLNSVRARLETFGLKESPQEVSRLEVQVLKLNSILAQLDDSAGRSVELKFLLQKSDRQVSAMEDQVRHLIEQNRRFEDAHLDNSKTELESSLNECNQLEESVKKSAQNVGDLTNQFGQLTSILAQLVVDVEQANSDFKVSSASTKCLYGKARLQGLGRC